MPSAAELMKLLTHPNESLSIEYKSWLNLRENADKANLAKAAIALANHGGGVIVLGMWPDNSDGGLLESRPRPADLRRYSQDDVNAAINRFAEPHFHSELQFAVHPETHVEHAFVLIPAGIGVPVMSSRDCEGVLVKWRCLIRKPGPQSQEPQTGEEWRALLDRCVRAGRESMLDAIRAIVQGHTGTEPSAEAIDALLQFAGTARDRWETLIAPLEEDDPARMPFGHYELSFEILDAEPFENLPALRHALDVAGRVRHTGWGPFVRLTRAPYLPRAVGGMIEAWLGAPDPDRERGAGHCDFWVAHPAGRLLLLRGYEEDESGPGTGFDLTLPIWRVGEAALYVARLARQLDENAHILMRCHYTGLAGRQLISLDHRRYAPHNRVCHDPEAILEIQATATQINDTLAEVMHPLLSPLYERFDFFQLPMEMVTQELDLMRRTRF